MLLLDLRRRVLADLYDRRQHRTDRHRFDEEFHPARDHEFRRATTWKRTAAFCARKLPGYVRAGGGRSGDRHGDSLLRRGGCLTGVCPRRARPRLRRASNCDVRARVERRRRAPAWQDSACCAWAAAPSTASCATSTPPCPTFTIARCTCGWIWTGATPRRSRVHRGRSHAQPCAPRARSLRGFESGSIQQIIYQIGTTLLADIPVIEEIHLEANNRTWDTIAEHGDALGVFTDARPPYGCLGLTLQR